MGILSFFIMSARKTRAMNKAANLMLNPNVGSFQAVIAHGEAVSKAFDNLYNQMISMPGFSEILMEHNATSKDLEEIAFRTLQAGYLFADNGDFIPVAVVAFGEALDYVLTNRDKILSYSYKEIGEVIDVAIQML